MNFSAVILAYLTIAFLIFITARGELPAYGQVFFGPVPSTQ